MPLRILVVDDSPVSRILITEMVRDGGHQVVAEAENLSQVMEAYKTHKPDVVTLDLSLASEDGLTILKALRGFDAKAKVIVISGNSQTKVIEDILATGADYLPKPFDQEGLLKALSKIRAA